MRLLVLAAAAVLPAGSVAAPPAAEPQQSPRAQPIPSAASGQKCRRPDLHEAQRGTAPQLKKLNELPPATAYMAVYRTIDGCEEPLTVVEYRQFGRR